MLARRYRLLIVASCTLATVAAAGAYALSYEAACERAEPAPHRATLMKAVVYRCYGRANVLEIAGVEKPTPAANEVPVKVHAVSVNPADWHAMTGTPYFIRFPNGIGAPPSTRFGRDFAGVVVAAGVDVTRFKLGDEVFGVRGGAMAEYITADVNRGIALKPPNITFEQAAAVPVAAGNHSPLATRRVLEQDGALVVISGPKEDPWIGPIIRVAEAALYAPFVSQDLTFFVARVTPDDVELLADLIRAGKVTPVIDREYPLNDVAAAVDYLGTGHARAKVVVTLE